MGMSIEEAINQIIDSLMGEKANLLNHSDRVALTDALNAMRKYQKIQEIYERFQKDGNYYHHMAWLDVMEVVKDGNGNSY